MHPGPEQDVAERKRAVRRQIGRSILEVPRTTRGEWDQRLAQRIVATPAFRDAKFVAAYLSLADEVNVDGLLIHAVGEGKQALLPVLAGNGLQFHAWLPRTRLHRDRLGVLEPADTVGVHLPPGPGVLLVPGRAFDRSGMRLGRGAGFYDRVLPSLDHAVIAVGVAYSIQLLDSVPASERDQPVRAVATERELLWCHGA